MKYVRVGRAQALVDGSSGGADLTAGRFSLASALILISVTGWTQTTSLVLTDDAHIADDAGDWLQAERNYGIRPLMLVHDWGPLYALVRFDATAISGQTVDSATLRLYLADLKTGGSISVHAITSPWTESSVTWNTGGSYEPVAETVIEVGSADVGSAVSVDITSLAAKWASAAQQNHGVLLRTTEPVRAIFDTKETPGGVPAELEVTASTGPSVYAKALDFTDPDDCIIDKAGYYILDRSWDFSPPDPQGACSNAADHVSRGVRIAADELTIDLRGFELKLMDPNFTDYGFATIRNSRVIGLGSIRVSSFETIVDGNLFHTNLTIENSYVISDRGIIIKNVVLNESQIGDGIRLQGGPAIVDSNIIRGGKVGNFQPYETEICYLGNNRPSAVIPQQGTENCMDWGGNVSF